MSAAGDQPGIPVSMRVLGGAMLLWGLLGVQLLRNSDTATGRGWALAIVFVVGGLALWALCTPRSLAWLRASPRRAGA